MSARRYKQGIIDDISDLSAGADITVTNGERLSGADLEQLRQAARAGAAATFDGTTKVVGTNAGYPGTPSNAALTGSDIESTTGAL